MTSSYDDDDTGVTSSHDGGDAGASRVLTVPRVQFHTADFCRGTLVSDEDDDCQITDTTKGIPLPGNAAESSRTIPVVSGQSGVELNY